MAKLITLNDLARDRNVNLKSGDLYDLSDKPVYNTTGERIGTVKDALADPDSGELRYLMLNGDSPLSDGSGNPVLVPVGYARVEDDGVYFDAIEQKQVRNVEADLTTYEDTAPVNDAAFTTPDRLRLLEERLVVDKERYVAGQVEIGKHVENREERASVNLTHEEAVIERRPVTDPRPVEGQVQLGADKQAIRVDLEAERANVRKEAVVAEEIEVKERAVSETRTFNETVGREVLDVNRTGEVKVENDGERNNRKK